MIKEEKLKLARFRLENNIELAKGVTVKENRRMPTDYTKKIIDDRLQDVHKLENKLGLPLTDIVHFRTWQNIEGK